MPSNKQRVKELLLDGDYEGAIAILKTIDNDSARNLQADLEARIAKEKTVDLTVRPEPVKRRTDKLMMAVYVVIGLGVIAFIGFTLVSTAMKDAAFKAKLDHDIPIEMAIQDACIDKYETKEMRRIYTLDSIVSGCMDAAEYIMQGWPDVAEMCAEKYPNDKPVMATCVDLRTTGFVEDWILKAGPTATPAKE